MVPRTAMSALYVDFSRLLCPPDYQGAGWIGFDPDALIEIRRIANAIGNAAAQSSAMTQNARGHEDAVKWAGYQCHDGGHRASTATPP
jgi:hypothetical protein